jgi:hypothetical protein
MKTDSTETQYSGRENHGGAAKNLGSVLKVEMDCD